MSKITVDGIEIDIIKKHIKNINISVYSPDGRVRISAPVKVSNEAINMFASSKLNWIRKQQQKFKSRDIRPEKEYVSGEEHYYLGNRYTLNLVFGSETHKVLMRDNMYLDMCVKMDSSKEDRAKILNEWYREQLKARIPDIFGKWEDVIGVSVDSWGVRNMKTRWGSCNIAKKRVWLNLQLAKKSLHCLEYVVVHEMVHLIERYHNDRFKACMDKFLPDWRKLRKEINNNAL